MIRFETVGNYLTNQYIQVGEDDVWHVIFVTPVGDFHQRRYKQSNNIKKWWLTYCAKEGSGSTKLDKTTGQSGGSTSLATNKTT